MTAQELFNKATIRGFQFEQREGKLFVSPKDRCPPDLATELRQDKLELLNYVSRTPRRGWLAVPPTNLPLNPLTPSPTAARREAVIAYLLRQTSDRPERLTAWLRGRETAYCDGPGRHWDRGLIHYAAARDAACWQLNCTDEREVWQLLEVNELESEQRTQQLDVLPPSSATPLAAGNYDRPHLLGAWQSIKDA